VANTNKICLRTESRSPLLEAFGIKSPKKEIIELKRFRGFAKFKLRITFANLFRKHKNFKVETLSYKTISANKQTIEKKWFVADAEGKTLGRFSSEIAKVLRGKNKPSFTPHADSGDNVIVLNAEKVVLTADKMNTKEYQFYSGHPGGRRVVTAKKLMEKKPEALIEKAVRGMLPKNRLGRKVFGNLFVYAGNEHPHQAQQPENLAI
jgi:large subunit ribosomal protein L13